MRPFLLGSWMRRAVLLALPLLLHFSGTLSAQNPSSFDAAKSLTEARQRLKDLGTPRSEEDERWSQEISRRISLLEEVLKAQEEEKSLTRIGDLDQRKAKVEAALKAEGDKELPTSILMESAEELAQYENAFTQAQKNKEQCQSSLEQLKRKNDQAAEASSTLDQRESKARSLVEQLTDDDDLTKYRKASAHIEIQAVTVGKTFLNQARSKWPGVINTLQNEFDLSELRLKQARAALDLARQEAAKLRSGEAERAKELAESEAKAAEQESDPLEQFRRTILAEAALARSEKIATQNVIDSLKTRETTEKMTIEALSKEKERLELRLKVQGVTAEDLLQSTLRRAERRQQILNSVTLPQFNDASEKNQRRLAEALDRLWAIQIPGEDNTLRETLLKSLPPDRHEEATSVFSQVIDGTNGLAHGLRDLQLALGQAERGYNDLALILSQQNTTLEEYRTFVRSRLLWMRSDPPITFRTVKDALTEIALIPDSYTDAGHEIQDAVVKKPLPVALKVVILALLFFVLPRLTRRKHAPLPEEEPLSRSRLFKELLVGLIWVGSVPLGIFLLKIVMDRSSYPSAIQGPLVNILGPLAWITLARRFGSRFLGRDGIAVRSRSLRPEVAAQLYRSIRVVSVAAIFFYLPSRVLSQEPFQFESLPRLFHVMWRTCMAISMILLTLPNGAVVRHWTQPGGISRRIARIFGPILSLGLVAALVLGAAGYQVGADFIIINLSQAFTATVLLATLYRISSRIVGRVVKTIRQRAAREQGTKDTSEAAVHLLTRVLATTIIFISAIILHYFWDIETLLREVLGDVKLLEVDEEQGQWLSLWEVLLALLWIGAGHYVARNIANIYESVIVPLRVQATEGSKFALLTISRYAILLMTYTAALLTLGFTLGSLGWLATGASVGIGFGLQEVIANFISGLIILFEQPIRVGDTITVGTSGGTVEKITIRATVVTNWERQTIIIPNKDFITKELTNWTRTDRIMRRTVNLGVAYGSDVEKVLRLLDQTVGDHPNTLKDPPHRIWFKGFGDFALEFEVWFFTHLDVGLSTRSDLVGRIYKTLREEGIQIPIPKQDIHVTGDLPRDESSPATSPKRDDR